MFVFVSIVAIATTGAADESGSRDELTAGVAKSVTSAKTAIKGHVSDPSGETYGVVGVSDSPDGAGLGAANTGGGPDLVLDGGGDPDAVVTEAGIDRPSASLQTFTLHNSGTGVLDLYVEGTLFGNGSGLTGVNASLLDGVTAGEFTLAVDLATSGSSSVHWDNITNEPAGLWDGDDDSLGGLECGEAQIAKWNGSSWVCSHDVGVAYARTRVVGPVGTPPENGATLLDAILGIPTPASQEEAWLLKIEPGVYDVGSAPFGMKSRVDVEGSGQDVTLIRGAVCDSGWSFTKGVVVGAESAELRSISVENTCSGANTSSTGIYNTADNARFNRVTASVFGAAEYNHAIYNEGSDVVFESVTAEAGGATDTNRGLVDGGTGVSISNARVSGLAGGSDSTGLELFGGGTALTNVEVIARNATAYTWAVFNAGSNVRFTNVTATASSTHGGEQIGVYGDREPARFENSHVAAEDAVVLDISTSHTDVSFDRSTLDGSRYGLVIDADVSASFVDVFVSHCKIRGPTNSIKVSGPDLNVGGSQLAGGAVSNLGGGTTRCAGVWDEGYTFYASTCP
jgi:hypothetical protein